MYNVQELFEYYERSVSAQDGDAAEITAAAIYAHPDDEIIHSNLLAKARKFGIKLIGMTATIGEATSINHRLHDPDFDLVEGGRIAEAYAGQMQVGFAEHYAFTGTDSKLERDVPRLARSAADLLVAHDVQLVFGISQMGPDDSYDHEAARQIAHRSAHLASQELGHVGLLTIQADGSGPWHAESSAESLEIVSQIALANRSQYRIGMTADRPGHWFEVSPGYVMHPEDWAQLDGMYPITGTATYDYAQCGTRLVPELARRS